MEINVVTHLQFSLMLVSTESEIYQNGGLEHMIFNNVFSNFSSEIKSPRITSGYPLNSVFEQVYIKMEKPCFHTEVKKSRSTLATF